MNNYASNQKNDFQSTSLSVFQSKKLWSEFRQELSTRKITNAEAVRVMLHQFIQEKRTEIDSELNLKRSSSCHETVSNSSAASGGLLPSSSIGSVFGRVLSRDGKLSNTRESSERSLLSKEDGVKCRKKTSLFAHKPPHILDSSLDDSEKTWFNLDDSDANRYYKNVIRGDLAIFSEQDSHYKGGNEKSSSKFSFARKESVSAVESFDESSFHLLSRLRNNLNMTSLVSEIDSKSTCERIMLNDTELHTYMSQTRAKKHEFVTVVGNGNLSKTTIGLNYVSGYASDDEESAPSDFDEDASNNGIFEFPIASRQIFKAKQTSSLRTDTQNKKAHSDQNRSILPSRPALDEQSDSQCSPISISCNQVQDIETMSGSRTIEQDSSRKYDDQFRNINDGSFLIEWDDSIFFLHTGDDCDGSEDAVVESHAQATQHQ